MFDGNELSRGKSTPDGPSSAEPIGTFGMGKARRWEVQRRGAVCENRSLWRSIPRCTAETKASSQEWLEGVEMVDELTQPARTLAVGKKGQPRQVHQIRFVEFLRERPAQFEGTLG